MSLHEREDFGIGQGNHKCFQGRERVQSVHKIPVPDPSRRESENINE